MALLLYVVAIILLGLQAFGFQFGRVSPGWLGAALALFTYAVLGHLD